MRKNYFLYLSLISLLASVESYKAKASMRDICNDLINNNVIQKANSAYTYIASNSSHINFTDADLSGLCNSIMTPLYNIKIDQIPELHVNSNFELANTLSNYLILAIGTTTFIMTVYLGCKHYRGEYDIYKTLDTINTNLIAINGTLGNTNIKLNEISVNVLHNLSNPPLKIEDSLNKLKNPKRKK